MKSQAFQDGYKAGSGDRLINWRSRYASTYVASESEYQRDYCLGYRAGWWAKHKEIAQRGW